MDICERPRPSTSTLLLLLVWLSGHASEGTPPRTPWGDPDLNGVWDFSTATPLVRLDVHEGKIHFTPEEAQAFLDSGAERLESAIREFDGEENFVGVELWIPHDAPLTGDLRTSRIIDPENGKIPALTAEAQTRMAAAGALFARPPEGPEDRPAFERCILGFSTGPPIEAFFGYNSLLQIFQAEDTVAILMEMVNDSRIIPLVEKPPLAEGIRFWKGDSRGYWDGETLVVETSGFRTEKPSFHGSGPDMRVTERFTRASEDRIQYEFTIDDPESFVSPWTARYPFRRVEGPLYEYACHEANRSMELMLKGARLSERDSR